MREFSKISPAVWRSKRYRNLSTDDVRYLHLYLLTCEHQNSAGAFRLPVGYACNDLEWDKVQYTEALAELEHARLIAFDPETEEVLIDNWFRYNPPTNPKHRIGIEATAERLESERLRDLIFKSLELASPTAEQAVGPAERGDESSRLLGTKFMRRGTT